MVSIILQLDPITALVTLTPDASGAVTQTLKQNRLYTIAASPTLASLTLAADADMKYSGLDFQTGSTAPTLAYTSGWKWMGADCAGGAFTPKSSKSYRIAFEAGSSLLAYVQEVK